jgi:hypothetical protein
MVSLCWGQSMTAFFSCMPGFGIQLARSLKQGRTTILGGECGSVSCVAGQSAGYVSACSSLQSTPWSWHHSFSLLYLLLRSLPGDMVARSRRRVLSSLSRKVPFVSKYIRRNGANFEVELLLPLSNAVHSLYQVFSYQFPGGSDSRHCHFVSCFANSVQSDA